MNKEQSFNLVRSILSSSIFHSQSLEQRTNILNQIVATGEITREELFNLINETLQQKTKEIRNPLLDNNQFIERLDYNVFVNFVTKENIQGKNLIYLCNSSQKLNGFCNKALILPNGNILDQYLFRLLLDKKGIRLLPGQIPRQIYKQKVIGGKVWGFGSKLYEELILSREQQKLVPTLIRDLSGVTAITTGNNHSLVLDNQGRVWAFGDNIFGQLGLSDIRTISIPTLIPGLNGVVAVSTGNGHSLILDNYGRVWSFGFNKYGQLGFGDNLDRSTPHLIPNLENIVAVNCGYDHSFVLDNQGHVWCFGANHFGQLGLGYQTPSQPLPTLIPNLNEIITASAGSSHSLVLDNQGRVWSFGNNLYGQLGLGDNEERLIPTLIPDFDSIIAISAGEGHSLILDNQGRVWSFGFNTKGRLGLGDRNYRLIPTLIPNLDNIIAVSTYGLNSLVLDNRGRVWGFGSNRYGQLGLGDNEERLIPTLIPDLDGVIEVSAGSGYSLILK